MSTLITFVDPGRFTAVPAVVTIRSPASTAPTFSAASIERGATLVRGARRLGLVKPGEHLFIVQGIQEWRRAHARK